MLMPINKSEIRKAYMLVRKLRFSRCIAENHMPCQSWILLRKWHQSFDCMWSKPYHLTVITISCKSFVKLFFSRFLNLNYMCRRSYFVCFLYTKHFSLFTYKRKYHNTTDCRFEKETANISRAKKNNFESVLLFAISANEMQTINLYIRT